jgi:hypothetical protein
MAQAPDALGETIVADGATTRSERVHDGLMTVCLALPISAGSGPAGTTASRVRSLQSPAACQTTMLAADVFVRPCVHAEVSSQQANRAKL